LVPGESEPRALLALMLLHDARRPARTTPEGELVLLDEQDRTLWNRPQILEGLAFAAAAMSTPQPGLYAVQAAIAAEHARPERAADTDWRRIGQLYDVLLRLRPTPIVELNRAVAVAMVDGPERGLELVAEIQSRGDLSEYYLLWSAKAD